MSSECELGLQAGGLAAFLPLDQLPLSQHPQPSRTLLPPQPRDGQPLPLGIYLLTSLGKELGVYLFEVLLVDDAAGAFLHRDNQTQQRHTPPPLGQRLPEGGQIILPLWNLPEFW